MFKIIFILFSAVVLSTSSFACKRSQDCKCRPGVDQITCKKLGGGPQIPRGVFKKVCVCKYH